MAKVTICYDSNGRVTGVNRPCSRAEQSIKVRPKDMGDVIKRPWKWRVVDGRLVVRPKEELAAEKRRRQLIKARKKKIKEIEWWFEEEIQKRLRLLLGTAYTALQAKKSAAIMQVNMATTVQDVEKVKP